MLMSALQFFLSCTYIFSYVQSFAIFKKKKTTELSTGLLKNSPTKASGGWHIYTDSVRHRDVGDTQRAISA